MELLLSRDFLPGFSEYEFVLVYQVDASSFRAELGYWCERARPQRRRAHQPGHAPGVRNGAFSVAAGWSEDWFWSLEAAKYAAAFRVAPNEDGRRFAFDEQPEEHLAALGGQLPFGCHGWTGKRAFWEPYLLAG